MARVSGLAKLIRQIRPAFMRARGKYLTLVWGMPIGDGTTIAMCCGHGEAQGSEGAGAKAWSRA